MSPKPTPIPTALPPSPPLSPKYRFPIVDRIFRILRLYRAGTLPGPSQYEYRPFHFPAQYFAEFQRRLEEEGDESFVGWYKDKLRWDYDPREGGFYTLRMPSRVHERFTALVDEAIYTAVKDLSRDVKGLDGVYQGRSTTLALHAPRLENSSQEDDAADAIVHRSPDATFYHRERDALPVCVVEVSYSQQRKDLPRLAESYVVDSRHAVRCVVGLDIAYGKGGRREATVSVWRPGMEVDDEGERVGVCRCDVDAVVVRGSDGVVQQGELVLGVRDFVTEDLLLDGEAEKSITISFSKLAEFLADAGSQTTASSSSNQPKTPSAPKKFRKRKRSPSEELSDGREAAYLKLEEAELEREKKVDAEWKGAGWTQDEAAVEVVVRRRSKRSKAGRAVGEAS